MSLKTYTLDRIFPIFYTNLLLLLWLVELKNIYLYALFKKY
jgi:hypothetical protein